VGDILRNRGVESTFSPLGGGLLGSIGGFELLLLAIVGLLVFGPRRLPAFGRTVAKGLGDLKRVTTDLRSTLENEAGLEDVKNMAGSLKNSIQRESNKFMRDLETEAEHVKPKVPGEKEKKGEPRGNPER
jgi:sec-independent protein translocase protein TatB